MSGPSAAEVVGAYLATQASAIHELDPLVRAGEPDAVHQLRVATRRLRSALASFGRVLDRGQTDAVAEELAWLADVLGRPRDLEVQTELIASLISDPTLATAVRWTLGEEREHAQETALAAMESERYAVLLGDVAELVAEPPWTKRAQKAADSALRPVSRKERGRVLQRAAIAAQSPAGPVRDARLHDVRKAAKRARYAAEAMGSRSRAKEMEALQEVLGRHHDVVVARDTVRAIAPTVPGLNVDDLLRGLDERAAECEAEYARLSL